MTPAQPDSMQTYQSAALGPCPSSWKTMASPRNHFSFKVLGNSIQSLTTIRKKVAHAIAVLKLSNSTTNRDSTITWHRASRALSFTEYKMPAHLQSAATPHRRYQH